MINFSVLNEEELAALTAGMCVAVAVQENDQEKLETFRKMGAPDEAKKYFRQVHEAFHEEISRRSERKHEYGRQ